MQGWAKMPFKEEVELYLRFRLLKSLLSNIFNNYGMQGWAKMPFKEEVELYLRFRLLVVTCYTWLLYTC
jgi:hypothetical protein